MNKETFHRAEPDDLLDLAIQELRQQEIPAFPKEQLPRFPKTPVVFEPSFRTTQFLFLKPALATTSAAVVLVVALIMFLSTTSQTGFAQMQQALSDVTMLGYTVLDQHDNWNGQPKTFETKVLIVDTFGSRAESEHNGIFISDWKSDRQLHIHPDKKTATFYESKPSADWLARRLEFVNKMKNIPAHATRRIGQTKIDGKAAEQFTTQIDDREYVVTIDMDTKLPIRMEYQKSGYREIKTDFVFDQQVDLKLLALEVPDGYQIQTHKLGAQPEWAETLVVSPETGLGEFEFGSDIKEVMEYLGSPSDRKDHETRGPDGQVHSSTTLDYDTLGLKLFFNANGLASMNCKSQARNGPVVHDFAGQTDKGISIGESSEQVVKEYGEPDFLNDERMHYVRQGIEFYLKKDLVVGIQIVQPLHSSLDFQVDPKTGATRIWVRDTDD